MDWDALEAKRVVPPFQPDVSELLLVACIRGQVVDAVYDIFY